MWHPDVSGRRLTKCPHVHEVVDEHPSSRTREKPYFQKFALDHELLDRFRRAAGRPQSLQREREQHGCRVMQGLHFSRTVFL
jgi:hypothetical protein